MQINLEKEPKINLLESNGNVIYLDFEPGDSTRYKILYRQTMHATMIAAFVGSGNTGIVGPEELEFQLQVLKEAEGFNEWAQSGPAKYLKEKMGENINVYTLRAIVHGWAIVKEHIKEMI